MSFDGLFTREMVFELRKTIEGGRISKIHQPSKNELVMIVRAQGKNHKVLLSAHPSYARAHLTHEDFENPSTPPMFCMLLRKHLEGSVIEKIEQHGLDRMIVFDVIGRDEIGDISIKQLIIEIMGRHSNIILIQKEKRTILDCIKHVPMALNSYRTLLPGAPYVFPPSQDKVNPFESTRDVILHKIDFNSGKLDKQLTQSFLGFSPLISKEIVHQSGLANRETLPTSFLAMITKLNDHQIKPAMIEGEKLSFYLFPLDHLNGTSKIFETLGELLDRFYFGKATRDRVKQQANDLERLIKNEKEKNDLKLIKLQQSLHDAEDSAKYQLFGELLTANLHSLKKGFERAELINYYDENQGVMIIPLDKQKTPSENAQRYFTKYQKSKTAKIAIAEQLELTKTEILYFESLLQQLETASIRDIEEIREELVEGKYLRSRLKDKNKKKKIKKLELEMYYATDGTQILVGKNNKQNDFLTNKTAAKDDVWLHTKDIPGSHVVIRHSSPNEQTINEAAILASFFSKARDSSSVPVDFTKIRHVKKPSGAKPGFVTYDHQKTVFVTPNADQVIKMKNRPNM